MSSGDKKYNQLVEEQNSSSDKKKQNEKINEKPLIKKSSSDEKDITIELSSHKKEEDEKSINSAEFSAQYLKDEYLKKIPKTSRERKPVKLSQKQYDKYTQKMKERTMRMELQKIDKETERLKRKYEEKHSFLHLFDNNPQFQKMLNFVQKQLLLFFLLGVLLVIFSGIIYFYVTKGKLGIAMASFSLSITELSLFVILIISLKLGLLNDPNLSKAFRIFVVFEFFMLIALFIVNLITIFFIKKYLKKIDTKAKIFIYILFLLILILFIISFKYNFDLFVESMLILLNKKTEYSILILNEQNSKTEVNAIENLSNSNNVTSSALLSNSNGILTENQNNKEINKEEEQFRNFNYFNKFHYSVTTNRKEDKYFLNKLNKII